MKIGKRDHTNRPFLIAFCFALILLVLFSAFLFAEASRENEKKINRLTNDYAQFQNRIDAFFTTNINLLTGFSAYIQTVEEYSDDEIYTFLENLTKNNNEYIKNIGIIQDTTIKWNYPLSGNESSVGIDLSLIPDQASSIKYVKTTHNYHFDGPKQLVQGGTGYIIRIPLMKDNEYWGMVSIVLKAEKVHELFSQYAEESNLGVTILNHSNEDTLIFGDASERKEDCLTFESTVLGNQWTYYVVSLKTEHTHWSYLLLIAFSGIVIIAIIVRYVYYFFRESERVMAKNDILNSVVFRDRLTGIYNRSFLDIRIQEEIDHANRYGTPLSIAYFDLDHFKSVNDNFGHSHGDAVLREIAGKVGAELRSSDILARWGGEEFAVLMPSTTLLGAATSAEKIRLMLETIDHNVVGKVTASFGVAEYISNEYAGSWFKRVDQALYHSKKEGRNRVKISEPSASDYSVQYRIKWLDEWDSGNGSIDADHKELLKLGNQLIEDSYSFNTTEEALPRYYEFLNHIAAHFEMEERILEKEHYDKLPDHTLQHKILKAQAMAFLEESNTNTVDPQRLFGFLLNEIVMGHLAKEDVKYFNLFHR